MYKLYSIPGTCSTGINVLLRQLKQDFEIINPTMISNYQGISPTGQVPALDDGGLIITEGAAITLHLLTKHDPNFNNASLTKNAEFLRWLMFGCATQHPAYSKMFTMNNLLENGPQKGPILQALADQVSKNWAIINARLEHQQFITGNSASMVDYFAVIYASWGKFFPEQSICLGKNTLELIKRISDLPIFEHAYASEKIQYSLIP